MIRRHLGYIHNFSCWHNAAIATLGRVSDRVDLVAFAIDSEFGERAQLREGMLADGLWWEGSMSYHFYSLWALLVSAIASRHVEGFDLLSNPALERALRAPIDCSYADGTLPATHDCWYFTSVVSECCHGVPRAPAFYEVGLSAYGDPAFAAVLGRSYAGSPRDSVYAILLGLDELPPQPWPERRSVALVPSGLAFLRPAPNLDLMLKFGPPGDYHGHPDKLSITVWANGHRHSPDLGTPGYGVANLETWYRQTISHNTVLIDGISQPPATGALHHLETESLPHVADARVEWTEGSYAGIAMRRTIRAHAEYFVDVFVVSCPEPRTIEWVYHNAGEIGREGNRIRWQDGEHALDLWLAPVGEEVLSGRSPGPVPTVEFGFLSRRRSASSAIFIAVLHPYRLAPAVRDVIWHSEFRFDVQLDHRLDSYCLDESTI